MQTSGLTGSSNIAISRKYGSTHPRHHESKDRQAMLTCFRWVSHHLLQANCAGVKYLYETPLFSGLLDSVTSGQPGTGSPILCQGSKVTLAQRRPRAKTRLRRAGWPAWNTSWCPCPAAAPAVPGLALVPLHASAMCHRGATFVSEQGALGSTLMLLRANACSGVSVGLQSQQSKHFLASSLTT